MKYRLTFKDGRPHRNVSKDKHQGVERPSTREEIAVTNRGTDDPSPRPTTNLRFGLSLDPETRFEKRLFFLRGRRYSLHLGLLTGIRFHFVRGRLYLSDALRPILYQLNATAK